LKSLPSITNTGGHGVATGVGIIYTAKSVADKNLKVAGDISDQVFSNFDKVCTQFPSFPVFENGLVL
jgi:hypothetical protein